MFPVKDGRRLAISCEGSRQPTPLSERTIPQMSKFRMGVAAAIIAAVAAVVPASPASAHPSAGVGGFVGNANVSGLWFPVSPFCPLEDPALPECERDATWNFSSFLDVVLSTDTAGSFAGTVAGNPTGAPWALPAPFVGAGRVSGGGSLLGHCGGSVGGGTASFDGHTSSGAVFATAGGTGVLVGLVNGHLGAVGATFQARPLPTAGLVPCLDHAATNFLVVGVGGGAAA